MSTYPSWAFWAGLCKQQPWEVDDIVFGWDGQGSERPGHTPKVPESGSSMVGSNSVLSDSRDRTVPYPCSIASGQESFLNYLQFSGGKILSGSHLPCSPREGRTPLTAKRGHHDCPRGDNLQYKRRATPKDTSRIRTPASNRPRITKLQGGPGRHTY